MRLFLQSSWQPVFTQELLKLVGAGRRALIITNARDYKTPEALKTIYEQTAASLGAFGFQSQQLDLRQIKGEALRGRLETCDLLWVIGGNTFLLRAAMAASGFDEIIKSSLAQDSLVYAGYSAGVCVLGPTLRGVEQMDDAEAVAQIYGSKVVWEGVGVLPEVVVPHYPKLGEGGAAEAVKVAQVLAQNKISYKTLHDGQAIVVDGAQTCVLG